MYSREEPILDNAVSNIAKQLLIFPQEKIYLQTDKPYYISGEKLFFRAFLLDAVSNKQDTLSRYVYVELIDSEDSVVQRVKIRRDSAYLFYGAIPLSEELTQGMYKIRAYTQYMRNQGENSFFSKQVRISDPQSLEIQNQTDFQFAEAGKINVSLQFINATSQEVILPQSIFMQLNQDPSFTRKPDKEGRIHFQLNLPVEKSQRVLYVELTVNNRIYKQYLQIPYPEGDFDVSFYPEGGQLIAGQVSNVAFKALDSGGNPLKINGEVIDSTGKVITEFQTIHDGMGEFFLNPLPDEHYKAVCHHGNHTLKFDLPETQKSALALKVIFLRDKLFVSINKEDSIAYPDLYLLIHSRGSIVYAKAWNPSTDYVALDSSVFPSGINHILLLTKDFRIVSERLVFLLNNDNGFAEYKTQKDIYRKREQVQTNIQLKDGNQQPLKGNISIAVTNDNEVVTDSTSSILSDILLRSELRGQIDNPEYYFQKGNKEAETAADLLMKTHGWTRYAVPDIIRGKLTHPRIPFEQSQEISGIVKYGLLSKPAKNAKVSLLSLNYEFSDLTETDENGRYVFNNFEFPDRTKYVIQALNKKGKGGQMTELYINKDTFPSIYTPWIEPVIMGEKTDSILLGYVAKADKQYTYEHGMRIINLPEVQIRGIHRYNNEYNTRYISGDELKRSRSLISLLHRVPGSLLPGTSLSIEINGKSQINPDPNAIPPGPLALSPSESSIMDINNLNMINIQNLQAVGIEGGAGHYTIVNYYKMVSDPIQPDNIKPIMPLGYQLPVEFYSPKYDTPEKINDSKPDLRTTIFWKPNVITDDAGNAKLDFYTSDDPSTYSVVIEGVSDDGKLIHYRGKASIVVK